MNRVVFAPSGLSVEVATGTTVLDAARHAGADLDSTCGGRGLCGRCQIVPSIGSFAKWQIESTADSITEWSATEEDYTGRRAIVDNQRLGCAANVCGDLVVEVPASSQVHKQVVRKSVNIGDIEIDPIVRLHYIELPHSESQRDSTLLNDQISDSLDREFGVAATAITETAFSRVAESAEQGNNTVTVAVRNGTEICAVYPGYVDVALGVAIDIGSTTIAGHLVDLSNGEILATNGIMNPQIRFGDDLMSRVSYVMMNPGGEVDLTSSVRTALDEMIGELVSEIGASRDAVLDMVVVGNPIMHHIFLGIDPTPLGQAPFPLAVEGATTRQATELEIDALFAEVYLLPCIAGHVGADTAGAILAEGPHRDEELQLLIDVGTNAEIVFGNATHLLAASSPTGPAFEGAQISAGQRATVGAIERVRIDRYTLEPRVRVVGCDVWSDDPMFTEQTARFEISGICGSGIIEVMAEMYLSGVIDTDGTIRSDAADRSERVFADGRTFSYRLWGDGDDTIAVTQDDVRAIQLAKAALRAGIDLLVEHANNNDPADNASAAGATTETAAEIGADSIGSVRLAGAFGAHIDPLYAKVLGLVPDVPVERISAVGNAAGAGAVRALVSASQRTEIEAVVTHVEKIETAIEPRFQELFIDAMGFPHTTAATPNLAEETALPASRPKPPRARRSRRQR